MEFEQGKLYFGSFSTLGDAVVVMRNEMGVSVGVFKGTVEDCTFIQPQGWGRVIITDAEGKSYTVSKNYAILTPLHEVSKFGHYADLLPAPELLMDEGERGALVKWLEWLTKSVKYDWSKKYE